jgi:diguanylate cyclase (GGDEF)-like protein
VHKKFGNFELALRHFEAFHESRARVFDAMARARVAQLESEAEVERARRDRELSQLRNVELASALEEVRQLNLELSEKARVLEELSNHDPLTGLHNRRYLYNRIAAEIQRFQRYGARFSVAIYDVDHFKLVNDVHSHAVGDEVLVTLAQLVESVLRESDVHARYGGEEFAVILPAAGMSEALRVMEKLREVVEGFEWQALAEGLAVTISAGVAEVRPDEEATPLLNRADGMLYEAKRAGRNRVHG